LFFNWANFSYRRNKKYEIKRKTMNYEEQEEQIVKANSAEFLKLIQDLDFIHLTMSCENCSVGIKLVTMKIYCDGYVWRCLNVQY
jgi:hypothetical protein